MLRILLAVDDYNELSYLQTFLKKIGFDTAGVQSHRKFNSTYWDLNPQIVVATAKGKQIDGFNLIKNVKRIKGWPKFVLLRSPGQVFDVSQIEASEADRILASPVNPRDFLETVARLGQVDSQPLLEKFLKIKSQVGRAEGDDEDVVLSENSADYDIDFPDPVSDATMPDASATNSDDFTEGREKKSRYQAIEKDLPKLDVKTFDKARVKHYNKLIRKAEKRAKLEDLEQERQEFVKTLFAEGKRKKG